MPSPGEDATNLMVAVGNHECSFDPGKFQDELRNQITSLHSSSSWAIFHLKSVARALGVHEISSQRSCFGCLSRCPTNMLPCENQQHAFCESCLRQAAPPPTRPADSVIIVDECPLGCRLTYRPWKIRVKPQLAQPRILVLDGYVQNLPPLPTSMSMSLTMLL